ncbi:MAG TPA: dTDP-4-dehydrorhamnose 3,5-epimerase [Rhabdochlamydiaceae bacterium]|nr:dTDP-4-dehydrorhamnose 3,5-epimerase [Rhabdochlamydiaceae bacterium]
MIDVVELSLNGLKLIKPKVFSDDRGFFLECYRREQYLKCGIEFEFVQDNHSYSKKDVLRGMHFQKSPGQVKLVSVLKGKILDVVVDIRLASPTFGQFESVILDGESHQQLLIPIGFAHGFLVLSEGAHVFYKVSSPYDPAEEKSFRFDDPMVGIQWPIKNALVSERDLEAPPFAEAIPC